MANNPETYLDTFFYVQWQDSGGNLYPKRGTVQVLGGTLADDQANNRTILTVSGGGGGSSPQGPDVRGTSSNWYVQQLSGPSSPGSMPVGAGCWLTWTAGSAIVKVGTATVLSADGSSNITLSSPATYLKLNATTEIDLQIGGTTQLLVQANLFAAATDNVVLLGNATNRYAAAYLGVTSSGSLTVLTVTGSSVDFQAPANHHNQDIKNAKTITYNGEVSNTGSAINWTAGQKQNVTLSANTTLTFTAPNGPCNVILKVKQDATGGWTLTWPASVLWPGGTPPAITATASAIDLVSLYYDGTHYFGTFAQAFA